MMLTKLFSDSRKVNIQNVQEDELKSVDVKSDVWIVTDGGMYCCAFFLELPENEDEAINIILNDDFYANDFVPIFNKLQREYPNDFKICVDTNIGEIIWTYLKEAKFILKERKDGYTHFYFKNSSLA